MTIRTTPAPLLDDQSIPVQAKIAAAWTSFMFLYAYVDILGLYKPGVIDGIVDGRMFEFDVTAALLTTFIAVLAVPALMVVFSLSLPARVSRVTNLVVASLYVPFTAFNIVGESGEWLVFYGLTVTIELLLLAFIIRSAWAWSRKPTGA